MRQSNDKYIPGDWNAICDVCGWKYKASELRAGVGRQKGLMVCKKDWDEPHPQDYIRSKEDNPRVPWARPEASNTFVSDPDCTIEERQGVAGQGVAGCAIAGLDSDLATEYDLPEGTFTNNNGTL